jgi:hypothetical protein
VRSDATSDRGSERQQTSSQDVAGSASLSLAAVSLGKLDLNREAEEQRLKNASSGLNSDVRDSFKGGGLIMAEVFSYLWLDDCKVGSHITGLSFRHREQRGRDVHI